MDCQVFLPVAYSGFRAIKAGLLADTYMEGHFIHKQKEQYQFFESTPESLARINELTRHPDILTRLATSIAPEIWGHEDVKRSLLLLLTGGVTKDMENGVKIRGALLLPCL